MGALFWVGIGACAIALGALIVLAIMRPSCEDMGMESKFSHYTPVCTKGCVLVPHYKCIPRANTTEAP